MRQRRLYKLPRHKRRFRFIGIHADGVDGIEKFNLLGGKGVHGCFPKTFRIGIS